MLVDFGASVSLEVQHPNDLGDLFATTGAACEAFPCPDAQGRRNAWEWALAIMAGGLVDDDWMIDAVRGTE
jgi:hypothetical protein